MNPNEIKKALEESISFDEPYESDFTLIRIEYIKNALAYINQLEAEVERFKNAQSPFENDIFSMIWKAFKNLYPDKECKCFWQPDIRDSEDGNKVYGLTDFGEDGNIIVFVTPELEVANAAEILAHELAHVAVGIEHEHDNVWDTAFDNIFNEYNRIGNEMFEIHEAMEVTDGKAYKKSDEYEAYKSDTINEFAESVINDILPKFMKGHEEMALKISFEISQKAKEMVGEQNV